MSEEKIASKYIDKDPPMGTEQQLERKNNDYLAYLKEKLNFILSNYGKRLTDADGHINELIRTADEFSITLSHKVGDDEVISSINQSAEQIRISANKIIIDGPTVVSSIMGETIEDTPGYNYWNLQTGEFQLTNGSLNIVTSTETSDQIVLRYTNGTLTYTNRMSPSAINLIASGGTMKNRTMQITRANTGIRFYDDDGTISGMGVGAVWIGGKGVGGVDGKFRVYDSAGNERALLTKDALTFYNTSGTATATYPSSGGGGSDIEAQSFTKNLDMSIAAGGNGYIDFTITKTGYTPIGITGIWGSGTNGMVWNDFFLVNNNTARIWYYNAKSAASKLSSLSIKVLYKKN